MSQEKTRTQLIDEAKALADRGIERAFPMRKYKRTYKADSKEERFKEGTEIGKGSRLIVRLNKDGNVAGYLLCAVLDIEDDSLTSWNMKTEFIVEVLEAGCADLQNMIGRLFSVGTGYFFGRSGKVLLEIGKANWDKYKVDAKS